MKYYVIGDLHGRFDLLKKAHSMAIDHAAGSEFKFVTLGDYIDRGPESRQVIDYLMSASQYPGVICLKGNHEAMMVESITKPLNSDWWIGNGGDATVQSYGWGGEPYGMYCYEVIPKAHLDWLSNLPIYFETEKQLFVHAGVPQSEMKLPPKKAHHLQDMQWMLYDKTDGRGWRGKHVVHGHHQFEDGPHVWHGPHGGRTDLDVYAWKTGRIVVGVFDDTQGPAKEFIEVKIDD